METVFQKIKEKLGCKSDTVHSQLQKLIIHEESDASAKSQCSSIDEPYATVIVQLPSLFAGNTLTVHYGNVQRQHYLVAKIPNLKSCMQVFIQHVTMRRLPWNLDTA